jgi:transposase
MSNDLRRLIVRAFKRGERQADIFHRLKSDGVSRPFISLTIKRWRETGSIADRPRTGRPRTVRTPERIKAVKARIRRNPRRSSRRLASQMGVSERSIRRILKEDLGLTPYKRRKVHGLSMQQRRARLERSNALLQRYDFGDVERIVFSDEKLFVVEEHLNAQNDRVVYAASFEAIPERVRTVQRFQKPGSAMVWGAVSNRGKFPLVFVESGVKINAAYYKEKILEGCLKVEAQRVFGQGQWTTFQQDSAPAHKAKVVQDWCRAQIPDSSSRHRNGPPPAPI